MITITRRQALAGVLATLLPLPVRAQSGTGPENLIARARARAERDWVAPSRVLAPPFDALDYDSYRAVRPRRGKAAALPLGSNFRADLLPPGWLFAEPVEITLPGHDTQLALDLFDFDPALITLPTTPPDMTGKGFSGIRFQTPLNDPAIWDEVLVMQGASYFRALARGTAYGLSARALALGTGGPTPEEFPMTEAIEVFDAGSDLHLGCLIDSPRASAALITTLTPGNVTRMRCSLHLFPRVTIADAGIAPLTSMFQHNPMGPARIDDFRPAVHDSTTLVVDTGSGERLWRPLANPAQLQMSAFLDTSPRGFALLQDPADFGTFRDAEAAYHRRPSAYVRPLGDWGAGAVMLLEIPTENEFADNIVAFWRPEAPLAPGEHVFSYDLDWIAPGPAELPQDPAELIPGFQASGVDPNTGASRLFVIDYTSRTGRLPDPLPEVDLKVDGEVAISGLAAYALPDDPATMRVSFLLTPASGAQVAELRLRLNAPSGQGLAPVWLYRWTPTIAGGV